MGLFKTIWAKIYHPRVKYWFRSRQIMSTRRRTLYEIDKALHFNSAITDSVWLREKGFTPGGCAADYGALLSIFKVLNIMHPEKTLEFGLGQSSKLIHQYAKHFDKFAVTVESDPVWTFDKRLLPRKCQHTPCRASSVQRSKDFGIHPARQHYGAGSL